ncbi:unnamed protein product [Toxocara canis]|uniref:Chromo domain-containing protein n=1 Tax=Toxocara canis TaxID=6265 RepID=A0A183V9B8_TOXCA|nr:unnamed protein product [Toxocara canis]
MEEDRKMMSMKNRGMTVMMMAMICVRSKKILQKRVSRSSGAVEYLIKWKDYDCEEANTWEPAENCVGGGVERGTIERWGINKYWTTDGLNSESVLHVSAQLAIKEFEERLMKKKRMAEVASKGNESPLLCHVETISSRDRVRLSNEHCESGNETEQKEGCDEESPVTLSNLRHRDVVLGERHNFLQGICGAQRSTRRTLLASQRRDEMVLLFESGLSIFNADLKLSQSQNVALESLKNGEIHRSVFFGESREEEASFILWSEQIRSDSSEERQKARLYLILRSKRQVEPRFEMSSAGIGDESSSYSYGGRALAQQAHLLRRRPLSSSLPYPDSDSNSELAALPSEDEVGENDRIKRAENSQQRCQRSRELCCLACGSEPTTGLDMQVHWGTTDSISKIRKLRDWEGLETEEYPWCPGLFFFGPGKWFFAQTRAYIRADTIVHIVHKLINYSLIRLQMVAAFHKCVGEPVQFEGLIKANVVLAKLVSSINGYFRSKNILFNARSSHIMLIR